MTRSARHAAAAPARASQVQGSIRAPEAPHRDATTELMQSAMARRKFQTAKWITADQVKRLLQVMAVDLHEALEDPELDQHMAALCALARADTRVTGAADLSLECWAKLRQQLLQLCRYVSVLPTLPHTGMARLAFIRSNLVALERTCHFSWARIARGELVQIFADRIAAAMLTNPAMYDSTGGSVSLDVVSPIPILSGGLELSVQALSRIDDEGNLVLSMSGSVAMSGSLSVPFVSAKLAGIASHSVFGYCRTAKDHVNVHFEALVAQYSEVPALARYMSCAGAAEMSAAEPAEIGRFSQMQNAFILKQDRYAQHFSLLLGSTVKDRPAALRTRPSNCVVNLCERRDPYIRTMEGTIDSVSTRASGTVRAVLAQADGQVDSLDRTNRLYRTRTLCEFLKDPYVKDQQKQALIDKVERTSVAVKRKVSAFWNLPPQPSPSALRITELDRLRLDWKHYTQFHAQSGQGPLSTHRAIEQFHEKYGARNQKTFLRNMALLTIDLYARMRAHGGPVAEVLEFEQTLHQTSIPGAREYLERYAQTSQEVIYTTRERTVLLTAAVGAQQRGIRISTAQADHYTPWRNGVSIKVEFLIGTDLALNQQVMHTIANHLRIAAPSAASFFGTGAFTRQGSYVVRLYRSHLLAGQPFRKSYVRRVEQTTQQVGGSMPIPLPVPVVVKAGASHTVSTTRMIDETLATDSVLYYATHFTHARWTNKIDASGRLQQKCYWNQIEQLHSGALEQLFLRYVGHSAESSELLEELRAIERAFMLDEAAMQRVESAKREFLARARQLKQLRNLVNYQAALSMFKVLLNEYFEGWKDTREAAPNWQDWTTDLV